MNEKAPILEVGDLEVVFPGKRGVLHAVNGVSFTVNRGETLGIVGESGCGKSTLGRALMGLVPSPGRVIAGSIKIAGECLQQMSSEERRKVRGSRIAMIFQDPMSSLNPVMTIGDQIRESLKIHMKLSRTAQTERVVNLLTQVGIPDPTRRIDAYPHQLSGGMRQRAGIAMAISCDPDILIADEPTTALDVTVQAQVIDLLKQLGRELGMAIIMISHDLGVVSGIADRVMVLYGGYAVETGKVADVLRRPEHPYTIGLIGSRAEIDKDRPERLQAIPGSTPSLLGPAMECVFRTRCPIAEEVCTLSNPELLVVEERNKQRVACHLRNRIQRTTGVASVPTVLGVTVDN